MSLDVAQTKKLLCIEWLCFGVGAERVLCFSRCVDFAGQLVDDVKTHSLYWWSTSLSTGQYSITKIITTCCIINNVLHALENQLCAQCSGAQSLDWALDRRFRSNQRRTLRQPRRNIIASITTWFGACMRSGPYAPRITNIFMIAKVSEVYTLESGMNLYLMLFVLIFT